MWKEFLSDCKKFTNLLGYYLKNDFVFSIKQTFEFLKNEFFLFFQSEIGPVLNTFSITNCYKVLVSPFYGLMCSVKFILEYCYYVIYPSIRFFNMGHFMVTWWWAIRVVSVVGAFISIICYSFFIVQDWVLDYYCFIIEHKKNLLFIYFELPHNLKVFKETQKIIIENSWSNQFNLLKLEYLYGIDQVKAELIYKYHLLKDVPLGSPISPPERVILSEVPFRLFTNRFFERVFSILVAGWFLTVMYGCPGPRPRGPGIDDIDFEF